MKEPILHVQLKVPLQTFDLDISFTTQKRVVGVFGPSGSGKTSLLESIAGLRSNATGIVSCSGDMLLDSKSGSDRPAKDRGIGYVPQEHLLFSHWNVKQNLHAGSRRARRNGHDFQTTFSEAVRVLELEDLLSRRVHTLSGGERQRVALGRALCSGPRLLLLDEPLASLDTTLSRKILSYLIKVRDAFEIPILIVSHNPIELLALCEEIVALKDGKVIAQGAPTDVLTRSEVYATAAQEGFQNMLPASVTRLDDHTVTVRLGSEPQAPCLSITRFDTELGKPVMLGIPSSDILVSKEAISGISARNCIAATIASVSPSNHQQIVTAQLNHSDAPAVAIELTRDAVAELDLAKGRAVWLVIKSSAIHVYP